MTRNEKIEQELRELSAIECPECGHCFLLKDSDINCEVLSALAQCIEQLDAETLGGEALDNARAILQKARGQ